MFHPGETRRNISRMLERRGQRGGSPNLFPNKSSAEFRPSEKYFRRNSLFFFFFSSFFVKKKKKKKKNSSSIYRYK